MCTSVHFIYSKVYSSCDGRRHAWMAHAKCAPTWSRGRLQLLSYGDMKTDGFMDKCTVFVIARGSGSRYSSLAATWEPASIRKLLAQSQTGNRRECKRVGVAVNHVIDWFSAYFLWEYSDRRSHMEKCTFSTHFHRQRGRELVFVCNRRG